MTYFIDKKLRNRLVDILKRYNLPYSDKYDVNDIIDKIRLDKKKTDLDKINVIYVKEIGKAEIRNMSLEEIGKLIGEKKDEE